MSNIRPYIIINGKNSNEINGLIISSLPPISKPPMRATSEEIDGRDGDIITKLGYSAYDKTIQIGLAGSYDVNDVISYFNQDGVVIFSNEPDKYYRFTQLNGIDFEKLIRFKTASVVFHCQPFKYSNTENPLIFLEPRSVSITNSGNTFSKPELAITGKGNVDMLINNKPVLSLDMGESQQTLIIDSEKMNTYGARSNIKKLDVEISPKQDLHGYDSVWLSPLNQMPYQSRINTNTGNLALEKLVGLTVCFNQLQKNDASTSSENGITYTNNGDGSFHVSGTFSSRTYKYFNISKSVNVSPSHVYFLTGNCEIPNGVKIVFEYFNGDTWLSASSINHNTSLQGGIIVKSPSNCTKINTLAIDFTNETQVGLEVDLTVKPQLFDLTAMFGSEVADYLYNLENS